MTRSMTGSNDGLSRREICLRAGGALVAVAAAPWIAGCGGGDSVDGRPTADARGDVSADARGPRRVVAYISADDVLAREVIAACTAATGVVIDAVFDTEATKTTGLESRIRAERDRPRCDLFWSSEGLAVTRLAAEGLLVELPEAVWSAWPAAHRDPARRWLAFAARARVVVTRIDGAAVECWGDLARPSLPRGSASAIAVADPRFGTTNGHFAALKLAWDRARALGLEASGAEARASEVRASGVPASEVRGLHAPRFEDWLDGMRANGVRVLTGGNAATVEAVATGESAYGLTDSDDALAAIARGLPLRMHLPRTLAAGVSGGGTMLVPNTVALVAGGPASSSAEGREAASRVAAYLVSPACEELIARSPSRNLPLGPKVAVEMPFAEADPLAFDAIEASRIAPALAVAAKARLESSTGARGADPSGGGA